MTTVAEARKAVDENAAKKVDLIKIWVDDRMGTVKKLSPELYSAVIDEAHKNKIRVIAHIYTLEDAKAAGRTLLALQPDFGVRRVAVGYSYNAKARNLALAEHLRLAGLPE